MVSDCPSSKRCGADVVAVKKAAAWSLSNVKDQANTSKKVHKAEREKLKRDHLNELFQELGRDLDPSGQNNCKASILGDAVWVLRDLLAQLEKLREEHAALISESRYVTLERDELRDENIALESEIGMLQHELSQRMQSSDHIWNSSSSSQDDTQLTLAQPMAAAMPQQQHHHPAVVIPLHQDFPPHGDARPSPLVQRPHARYPSPSDSWPAQLLSSLPGASQERNQQQQDPRLSCTSSSTSTSSGKEEGSTRSIQMDGNVKIG